MKLLDVNILIYAYDSSSARHDDSRTLLEEHLSDTETVGFAWTVLLAFLRLSTKPTIFESPLSIDEAFDIIDSWLDQPNSIVVHPTDRHSIVMRELLSTLGSGGNLTSDAHLGALSIEHGAELWSYDSDFSRFTGVRWFDPLKR